MASQQLIVTTQVKGSTSVFVNDHKIEEQTFPGDTKIRKFWQVHEVPVDIEESTGLVSGEGLKGIANERGLNFLSCEMVPGGQSPMHGTQTIDFGTVVAGEITLILDSGEERVLKAGDTYVQKGTPHVWENRGTIPARFVVVLVAGK